MFRLPQAWKHLKLTGTRKENGQWLKWRSDEPSDEGEPNKQSLEYNCPMVYCMFELLQNLDTVPVKPLMSMVSWLEYLNLKAFVCAEQITTLAHSRSRSSMIP